MNLNEKLPYFTRTGTHVVLDLLYSGFTSFDEIAIEMGKKIQSKDEIQKWNHNDISKLISDLERGGLINNLQITEFGRFVQILSLREALPLENMAIIGKKVLNEFMQYNLLLKPFFEVFIRPVQNNADIDDAFLDIALNVYRIEGLKQRKTVDDYVPAMKNFLRYLGMINDMEFTELGEKIFQLL